MYLQKTFTNYHYCLITVYYLPSGGYGHGYGPVSYTHLDVYKRQQ